MTKLNPKALAYASAAIWGGSVLLVGVANLSSPGYGREFLEWLDAVYPGYTVEGTLNSVMIGTGYALFHGAVAGWLFGWLYNRLAK